MSRNWTPREMYLMDLVMQREHNAFLRESMNNLVFVTPTGEEVPYLSEDKKKVLSMFKELGFLFGDNLYILWQKTQEHPRKRKKVLQATEEELEKLIEYDRAGKSLDCFDKVLVDWYWGELDPNFYYSEENNYLLEKYLYDKIMM